MNNDQARQTMVEQQVRVWDVSSPSVLAVLGEVERERFVPETCIDVAYADAEIPLAHHQVMLPPIIEGRLLQALAPKQTERALDIGTGSGYLAACLAMLCREVVSIDIYADFTEAAQRQLEAAGIGNVETLSMDASNTLPDGEFDVIAVSASLPALDERLVDALADGGRLFVVLGEAPVMTATLITRNGDAVERQELFETLIPPMINVHQDVEFSF